MANLRFPRHRRSQRRSKLVAWKPWAELVGVETRLNQRLGESLSGWFREERHGRQRMWSPPADIYETDSQLIMNIELAGVDPKEIEARIEGQTLLIKGERKPDRKARAKDYYLAERIYGPFALSLGLPDYVDHENVVANYRDGVLIITLAKREEARPKTIKIQPQSPGARAAAARS